MANTRIKDISTAATTLNSDDFIAVDGSTAGTRKMAKADLITEVSTGVSGTYLEESNNLSDVASKDTSKLNLEVPDVGTGPQEVPLNSMLSGMAYMSPDSVAMGTVEAESLEVTDKITTKDVGGVSKGQVEFQDSSYTISGGSYLGDIRQDAPRHRFFSGSTILAQIDQTTSYFQNTSLGIGTSSPSYELEVKAANARVASTSDGGVVNHLQSTATTGFIGTHTNHPLALKTNGTTRCTIDSSGKLTMASNGIKITGNATDSRSLAFTNAADTTGWSIGNGIIDSSHNFRFYDNTAGAARWTIDGSNGNLVAHSTGIDFGSAATSAGQGTNTTGSVSNSVLSDYEFGSWTPSFATSGADFAAITMDVIAAQYVKVGKHVHCQAYIRTDNVDRTGASGTVVVEGLPFVSDTSSGNYATLSVGYSSIWVNAPTAGYVQPNAAYAFLTRNGTTGISVISAASDITDGASSNVNELIFTISYIAST